MSVARRVALCGCVLLVSVGPACRHDSASRRFQAGEQYARQHKPKEAIIEYRAALQLDPKFGQARLRLAENYDAGGDTREAFHEYLRAADLLPDNVDLQLKAGSLLLYAGRFEDARTKARDILAKHPKNVPAHILLGNATAGLKDVDGALAELEDAVRLNPNQSRSYTQLATLQVISGQRDEAERTFRKAIDVDSSSIPARLALANYYWSSGRQAEANRTLIDALTLAPRDLRINRALAVTTIAEGQIAAAEPYVRTLAVVAADGESQLILADYYTLTQRNDEARELLRPLASDPRWFGPAMTRLANLDVNEGALAAASKTVSDLLVRRPKDVDALVLQARILVAQGKLNDAITSAQAATLANPASPGAWFVFGKTQLTRGDYPDARAAFLKVLELNPRAASAQVELARLDLAYGAKQQAVSDATSAVKTAPTSPDARQILVRALLATGDTQAAEGEIRKLLKEYPHSPTVHELMGALLVLKKDTAGGRREFVHANELDPKNLAVVSNLAALDLGQRNPHAARTRVDNQLARTPDDAKTIVLNARVYAATGDIQRAEALLTRAIEADHSNVEAYSLLAELDALQGKLPAARAQYARVLEQRPQSVAAYTALGVLFEADHMAADAEKSYERALALDPRAAVASNNLAWLFVQAGRNPDRALELARTAKGQAPDDPHINDTLGWIYYQRGLVTQALDMLEQSIRIDSNNPTALRHIGLVQYRSGDWVSARRSLQRVIRLNPNIDADTRNALAVMSMK
jgi:putative PEP-CTERM system TPR-repeat lipoprotein